MLSMTGYGKGETQRDGLNLSVEIKSVNHRYADISVKLPRSLLAYERELRKQVGQLLNRGKIDIYVNYEMTGEALATPQLNRELAEAYHNLFVSMQQEFELSGPISTELIAGQKDVVQMCEATLDEAFLGECLMESLSTALEQLLGMRKVEGEETRKDIEERLDLAEQLLVKIVDRAPQVPLEWQGKLTERLAKLQQNVEYDPQRVAQEIAIFTDRCDISEEIARFKSHIVQFRALLNVNEPVGRKMDFLVQELNREVNTMGSKSNDADLTMSVVTLKSEFEKVREQVQNIE